MPYVCMHACMHARAYIHIYICITNKYLCTGEEATNAREKEGSRAHKARSLLCASSAAWMQAHVYLHEASTYKMIAVAFFCLTLAHILMNSYNSVIYAQLRSDLLAA